MPLLFPLIFWYVCFGNQRTKLVAMKMSTSSGYRQGFQTPLHTGIHPVTSCVPSITLKDCAVILSWKRGFSSLFIKPREQRQPSENLPTSKQPVTLSVRLRLSREAARCLQMKEITTEEGHRMSSVHLEEGEGSPLTTLMFQLSWRPFSSFSQRNSAWAMVEEEEG